MKIKNYLYLSNLTLLLLHLCGDSNSGSLSIAGTVVAYDTATAIANAKIIIIGGITNGSFEPPTEFFVDSLFTDENGENEWDDSNATSADYYSISAVIKENYFTHSSPYAIFGNREEIILDPHAWLHINVIDDLTIPGDYLETYALLIRPNEFGEFEEKFELRGNRNIYIKKINGIGAPLLKDSLYLPALDTLYHEIKF